MQWLDQLVVAAGQNEHFIPWHTLFIVKDLESRCQGCQRGAIVMFGTVVLVNNVMAGGGGWELGEPQHFGNGGRCIGFVSRP